MLPDRVQFETPENIQVSYQAAGMGNRFLAWVADEIIMGLILFVIFIIVMIAGASGLFSGLDSLFGAADNGKDAAFILIGLFFLLSGLGNFAYFTLFELLMNGQTIGKHSASLRVVKADGFALDFGSIPIRNLFRVLDNIPLLWIVPIVSARSQRLGDMVAGTIVIVDKPSMLSAVRDQLAQREDAHSRFQFSLAQLSRLSPEDLGVVEQLYERASMVEAAQAAPFLKMACQSLSGKLGVEMPAPDEYLFFLRDFLAAEYRRQHRTLN